MRTGDAMITVGKGAIVTNQGRGTNRTGHNF